MEELERLKKERLNLRVQISQLEQQQEREILYSTEYRELQQKINPLRSENVELLRKINLLQAELASNPNLKRIDLTRGEGHEHPDFAEDKWYLCYVQDNFYNAKYVVGQFKRRSYGWDLETVGYNTFQYDKPGTGHCDWIAVWEIVEE